MKQSLTLALFLGLISKETAAVRLENHHRHNKHHATHQRLAQYNGDSQAWVDDCYPDRDVTAQANGGAGNNAVPAGQSVGIDCQGFAQRRSQSLAQYNGDSQAWIDDCYPDRDVTAQANGGAGINAAAAGVGVECQGFAQRGSRSLAQKKAHRLAQYNGDSQAWVDDCYPGRDVTAQANGGAGINAAVPGVGVECQGFAKRKP